MVFRKSSGIAGAFTTRAYVKRSGKPSPPMSQPYWLENNYQSIPNSTQYQSTRTFLHPLDPKTQWLCKSNDRCGKEFGTCYQGPTSDWGLVASAETGPLGGSRQVCQTNRSERNRPMGSATVGFAQ